MNKEQLHETVMSKGVWLDDDYYIKASVIQREIDQLDEPVKVVIPSFMAEFILGRRMQALHWFEALDELASDFHANDTTALGDRVYNWIMASPDKYVDAYRNGYTVEKEPKWVVNSKYGYFIDFAESHMDWTLGPNQRNTDDIREARTFRDKVKADALATLINGTVEEVTP